MIDIHSHILFGVDDGAKTLSDSIGMLKTEINIGVTDVILSPHYRGSFKAGREVIYKNYEALKNRASKERLNIGLYLGREVHISGRNYQTAFNEEVNRICGGKYILLEFDFSGNDEMADIVYELKLKGFIPIVAHIERYKGVDITVAREIRAEGGLIQVNAESVCGKCGFKVKRFVHSLIKNNLVDFISSDIHDYRQNYLLDAKNVITKKYGEDVAEKLFSKNAKKIIEGLE